MPAPIGEYAGDPVNNICRTGVVLAADERVSGGLKLDENIPTAVAVVLRGRGIDLDTVVEEFLGGHSDPAVLDAATQEDRLLITMDRGFGDIRAHPPGNHPGIIVLRPDHQPIPTVTTMVETLIDNHPIESLAGCVTIVQRNMLLVRRPTQDDLEGWAKSGGPDRFEPDASAADERGLVVRHVGPDIDEHVVVHEQLLGEARQIGELEDRLIPTPQPRRTGEIGHQPRL